VQSGVVVGPRAPSDARVPGGGPSRQHQLDEEIYTDELGRVKVQFPWDRLGKLDEQSSCWIPVTQAWAGPAWGAIFIPRVGQQVVVHFLDGDPDQPIVIGQIYHEQSPPPYQLPQHKTRSTIKTASSPGEPSRGRGHNEVRFEDRAGAEELHIRAQLDRNDLVQHDFTTRVGHDEKRTVKNDCQEEVCRHYLQVVGSESTQPAEIVKEVSVNGSQKEEILKDLRYWVGGLSHETIVDGRIVTTGMLDETVKGFRKTVVEKGDYTRIVKQGSATFDVQRGRYRLTAKDSLSLESDRERIYGTAKEGICLAAGGGASPARVDVLPDQIRFSVGDSVITMTASGITVEGQAVAVRARRGNVDIQANDDVRVRGERVRLN
jgi:type VI secretion system secreted protein VgrG